MLERLQLPVQVYWAQTRLLQFPRKMARSKGSSELECPLHNYHSAPTAIRLSWEWSQELDW
jgi:hypothetical protein